MPQYNKAQVKGLYDQMNSDGKDGLSALEIAKMMKMLGQADDAMSVQSYFDKHNKDGDGVLSFDEFYKAFTLKSNANVSNADLERMFKEFDSDGSNYLDINEVKELMKKSGKDTSKVEKDMEIMDKSKDGKISFSEFKSLITKL